jgi:hypothetical protein
VIAALIAAVAFAAPATYTYSASLAGQPVGQWSIAVRSDAGQAVLDEKSSANFGGMALGATATLTLDANLAPLRYDGRYSAPGQSIDVTVAVASNGATVTSQLATTPGPLQLAAGTTHFAIIEPGLLAGLFALPAQLNAWRESRVTWISPTSASAQLLTVGTGAAAARPTGVPANDAVVSIDRPIAVTIWYDPSSFVPDRIDVPSNKAVLTRIR